MPKSASPLIPTLAEVKPMKGRRFRTAAVLLLVLCPFIGLGLVQAFEHQRLNAALEQARRSLAAGRQSSARRQLLALGHTARTEVPMSILAAVVVMIGLPIVAIMVFFTVIGIPLGLAILLMLIPILWLLGYIVAGSLFGTWIRAKMGRTDAIGGIVWATLIGLLILQFVSLIPVIGGFILFLAGTYGAGVLVLHLIRQRGNRAATPVAAI